MPKDVNAKTWNIVPSYDTKRYTKYPLGNKPPDSPSWLGSTPVNGWIEIPGTTIGGASLPTVNPYSQDTAGLVDYWNGFCLDDENLILYATATGGHTDYAGNQVLRCDLGSSAGWTQPVVSSAAAAIPGVGSGTNSNTYTDGRPASSHTYYCSQFIRKANRAFLFGQGALWNGGGVSSAMFAYVEGASDWENTASNYEIWGSLSGAQTESVRMVAKHQTTEDVYYTAQPSGTSTLYKWTITGTTPGSASHTNLGATPVNLAFYCSAVDHTRNRIVFWRGNGLFGSSSTTVHIYDITGASWSTATLTGSAAGTITAGGNYQAMQYSSITDSFYTRLRGNSGGTTYIINASTFVASAVSTTGGAGIAADTNGPNNRYLYAPALAVGSTIGGIFYLPTFSSGVYFLRLH